MTNQESASQQDKKHLSFLQKIIIAFFVIGLIGSIFGEKDKPMTADNSSTISDEQLKQQIISETEKNCNQKNFGPEIQQIVPGLKPDRKAYSKCFGELYGEAMMILLEDGTDAESAQRIVLLLSIICLGVQNGDYSSLDSIKTKLPAIIKNAQNKSDLVTALHKTADILRNNSQPDQTKNTQKKKEGAEKKAIEKHPIAIWQNNHQYKVLDEQAKVMETEDKLPTDLLLIVGPDAPEHIIELIRDLEDVPEIHQYVRAAVRVGGKRWNLKLYNAENGVEILLPEQNVLEALQRLDYHNKREKLLQRLAAIDLRNPDKVILKPLKQDKSSQN